MNKWTSYFFLAVLLLNHANDLLLMIITKDKIDEVLACSLELSIYSAAFMTCERTTEISWSHLCVVCGNTVSSYEMAYYSARSNVLP